MDYVQVWRKSTGERLEPLPPDTIRLNPDLTTTPPQTEQVHACCGGGLITRPCPEYKGRANTKTGTTPQPKKETNK